MLLKNSLYSLGGKAVEAIITFAGIAVLARLLQPEHFGLFAIVLAIQALFQPILDMGLTAAYIKAKEDTSNLKNMFYSINVAFGLVNTSVLVFIALFIDLIYEESGLNVLILTFSLSVLIESMSKQRAAQLIRNQNFKLLNIVYISSGSIALIVSIFAALSGLGVWSLVIRAIARSFCNLLLLKLAVKQKFVLLLTGFSDLKPHLVFGSGVVLNRFITGIFDSFDKLIFGKLFGNDVLGQYSQASQVAKMSDTYIASPLSSVIYSNLERLNDVDKSSKILRLVVLVLVLPVLLGIFFLCYGDKLILFYLGEEWVFAAKIMPVMALYSMGNVFRGMNVVISMLDGRLSRVNARSIFSICVIFVVVYLGMDQADAFDYVYLLSVSYFSYWLCFLVLDMFNLKYNSALRRLKFWSIKK